MTTDLFQISVITSWSINVVAAVVGLLYCYRPNAPRYLGIFPIYLFVSALVEIVVNPQIQSILLFQPPWNRAHLMQPFYILYTVFELYSFLYFFLKILDNRQSKIWTISLTVVFTLIFLIKVIKSGFDHLGGRLVLLENIILLIPSLTFYRELLKKPESGNPAWQPSFWVVTGIFFYAAVLIPFSVAGFYMVRHYAPATIRKLYSINNFALIVTYILFMRGFICKTRK